MTNIRLKHITLVVLVLGCCSSSPAQSRSSKLRVLEGTVTGFFKSPRQIHISVESSGNSYDFPLATPGDGSQDPEIVGDVRTVGARIRVHYKNTTVATVTTKTRMEIFVTRPFVSGENRAFAAGKR